MIFVLQINQKTNNTVENLPLKVTKEISNVEKTKKSLKKDFLDLRNRNLTKSGMRFHNLILTPMRYHRITDNDIRILTVDEWADQGFKLCWD